MDTYVSYTYIHIPARCIIDDFENVEHFCQRETDSVISGNSREIYNFQQSLLKNKIKDDDVLSPIDPDQSFVREFLYQSGGHSKFVLFLD